MMEEYPNIKYSDEFAIFDIYPGTSTRISNLAIKLAIFDIWPRNFEYLGQFHYIRSYGASSPISDFTGRGQFVTYI